jgi:uncharacterized protein with HEPN domain
MTFEQTFGASRLTFVMLRLDPQMGKSCSREARFAGQPWEEIQTVTEFVSGRQATDLDTDRMFLFALVRPIEVVGEAAGKVSDELRLSVPDIPWNLIVSMHNRLIHAYFDIDRDILWKTATMDVGAEISCGAPDYVMRTVTENSRTLRFTSRGFKRE